MRWVGLLMVAGCFGPVDVEWSASFANAADDAEADFVFVDVREDYGGCPGDVDDLVRGPYQIRPEAPAGTIPTLEADEYCFHATAVRADCTLVAAGWLEVEVPRDEIQIVMTSMSGGGCSGTETCLQGRCIDEGTGMTCNVASAYCPRAGLCCTGDDEASACAFFDAVGASGCTDPS